MTDLRDDLIDPFERTLVRRVRGLTEQAVVPIDPVAIASASAVARRRQGVGARLFGGGGQVARLGLVLTGGLLIVAAAIAIGGGVTNNGPVATATQQAYVPAPSTAGCLADLEARILSWDGAAGHRTATVRLTNTGSEPCQVPGSVTPRLVGGNSILIAGDAVSGAAFTLAAGRYTDTMVQDGNYCGAPPVAPVTLSFSFDGGPAIIAAPVSPTDVDGVPPCNGRSQPATLEMQPWQP